MSSKYERRNLYVKQKKCGWGREWRRYESSSLWVRWLQRPVAFSRATHILAVFIVLWRGVEQEKENEFKSTKLFIGPLWPVSFKWNVAVRVAGPGNPAPQLRHIFIYKGWSVPVERNGTNLLRHTYKFTFYIFYSNSTHRHGDWRHLQWPFHDRINSKWAVGVRDRSRMQLRVKERKGKTLWLCLFAMRMNGLLLVAPHPPVDWRTDGECRVRLFPDFNWHSSSSLSCPQFPLSVQWRCL